MRASYCIFGGGGYNNKQAQQISCCCGCIFFAVSHAFFFLQCSPNVPLQKGNTHSLPVFGRLVGLVQLSPWEVTTFRFDPT